MTPPRPAVLQPEGWARPSGYTNGVAATGRHIFLAGQIGWNPQTGTIEQWDLVGQVRQSLRNIVTLLTEAGAEPSHIVRLTWFVVDRDAYMSSRREIGEVYREIIGRHFPPMSVVFVSALVEEGAQVEIETTAILPA